MQITLATSNKHKVQEINDMVADSDIEFILPPGEFDPIENGETFEENSKIKALEAWKLCKTWTLADDSGLCIKALAGKPGIYSARYAETPEKRIERVLKEMAGEQNREAYFVCAMTLINPAGNIEFSCNGICEGTIAQKPAGQNGFGYDPIFVIKNKNITMAELSESEKNKISHRYQALDQVCKYIACNIQSI